MADPILPNVFRIQAVMQSKTMLPEDDTVNTWAVSGSAFTGTFAPLEQVADDLRLFYEALKAMYPTALIANGLTFKCYHLGQEPPREPIIHEATWVPTGTQAIPEECAITLSLYGERNLPRQRGRIFLGPLAYTSLSVAGGKTEVSASQRTVIANAATALLGRAANNNYDLGIISQRDAAFVPIRNGWVDNALDTMRKRGPEATARTVFPVPAP